MNIIQYPALHELSSRYSGRCQRRYKTSAATSLLSLTVASALGLFAGITQFYLFATVAALLIAISFISFLVQEKGRGFGDWFDARAVAESVKTASWRFSVGASPYGMHLSQDEAIAAEKKEVVRRLDFSTERDDFDRPTESMRALRTSNWEARKSAYLAYRVKDQRQWYGGKSQLNDKKQLGWGIAVLIMQIAAVIAAVAAIWMRVDLSSVLLTATSSALAWMQVQQHKQLAHSYGIAASELALIEGKLRSACNEGEFVEMAAEAELAMSREHTLWIARNEF